MKVYTFGDAEKPAVLLLPGTCCHWESNFGQIIPLLASDFRVLCVSYDGFDETEWTEFPTMLEETAKIEDWIRANCGGHIRAAYGCSLGGSFVGLLAARGNIRMDFGILGGSDLDQASPLAAKLQTKLLLPLIYPLIRDGEFKLRFLRRRMAQQLEQDPEYTGAFMRLFGGARPYVSQRNCPMRDSELQFDRTCHVLYSKPCKRQIREKIALHYPEGECETVWERVQRQYVTFLRDWRTDLGGSKNFHNGKGGTYDCITLMSYYVVCREKTSLAEIEEMEGALFLPSFRRLRFVDCNKPFWRRLLHRAFVSSKKACDKWGDYEMHVAPYDPDEPIYYEFTACPTAEFARQFGLLEVMPALCSPDYAAMELLRARLVRRTTCSNGCRCDYTICGDRGAWCQEYPEYRDEAGYRRNTP